LLVSFCDLNYFRIEIYFLFPNLLILEETEDGLPFIDAKDESDVLIIRKIDPCNIINGISHHTSKFELMNRQFEPQLVVRRGQSFRLDITLNRPYNEEKDGVSFIFTVDGNKSRSYRCWILSWAVTLEISARRRSDKSVKNV
jgi:hypothetical protein